MIMRALAVLAAMLFLSGAAVAQAPCSKARTDVGGYKLWVDLTGVGPLTVVFEAGGGDESGVWSAIAPRVRALGVRTFVYDRAGLGRSDPRPGRYTIEAETEALRRLLDKCSVGRPIILVSHSYGGFIAWLTAQRDRRIAGLVNVDANIPSFFSKRELDLILATYRPQYPALRAQAPALAAVMIPMMEAYPATAHRLRRATLPPGLPIIDIVAEHSWALTPASAAAMRAAHADFVRAAPGRIALFAAGSSHKVMQDRPDLVVDAIARMVRTVTSAEVRAAPYSHH